MTSADRQRKIAALRALAERPGTPAEGETARKMLSKLAAQQPEPDPVSDFDGLKFAFGAGFDSVLFQQACRDAAESIRNHNSQFERNRSAGVYEHLFREQEDWHAQQRREADERQRRDAEAARKRAREATSANGQFQTSFADAVEQMNQTGETLAQVFARRKEEWLLSNRFAEWAKSRGVKK